MEQKQATVTNEVKSQTSDPAGTRLLPSQQGPTSDLPLEFVRRMQSVAGNRGTGRWLQAKLKIGPVNDVYEQEADQVAERVVNTVGALSTASRLAESRSSVGSDGLQRQPSAEDESISETGAANGAAAQVYSKDTEDLDLETEPATGTSLQRKCTSCEEEQKDVREHDLVQRKADSSLSRLSAAPHRLQKQRGCGDDGATSKDAECSECKKEDEGQLQRVANMTTKADCAPPIVDHVLQSSGHPLDRATRSFFETRLGFNLGSVRLHTDAQAVDSAKSVHARAYTVGQHVVFGQSEFSPESTSGRLLLAHELTHVIQQSKGASSVQRLESQDENFETEADTIANRMVAGDRISSIQPYFGPPVQRKPSSEEDPADSQMFGSLHGFVIESDPKATFGPGPIYPQLQAMELKKFLGSGYSKQILNQFIAEWGARRLYEDIPGEDKIFKIDPVKGPMARGGEKVHAVYLSHQSLRKEMRICHKIGSPFTLPPELQRYLELGEAAEFAFRHISLPKWFTKDLFMTVMAHRAQFLSELSETMKKESNPGALNSQSRESVLTFAESFQVPVTALDEIRADSSLVKHPVYQRLWPGAPAAGQPGTQLTVAPEDHPPIMLEAAGLIAYAEARPILTRDALQHSDARKKLLDSYDVASSYRHTLDPSKGNQPLSDFPTEYTAPPYPATLSMYPNLLNSLYGSTRSEYGFNMALDFPNIFASFQFHHYNFEAFRVPDDKFVNMSKALQGRGRGSSHWALLKSRLATDQRYEEADIQAYANSLWDQIGPPGKTADLIHLNAAMRNLGTVIGTAFEAFADPSYTARFAFPDEGLYVVRCVAQWNPGQEVTLKRPPSVAYQPLFARAPELIAEMQLQEQLNEIESAKKELPRTIDKINHTKDSKALEELQKRRKQLEAVIGGVSGMLGYQKELLDTSGGADASERAERIQDIIDTRKARGFDQGTERLPAVYVSDSGQVLDLLIEVKVDSFDPTTGSGNYSVNDATTPSSTSATGSGKRRAAIVEALTDIFKRSDYGRGKASVLIDGVLEPIDVPTVSEGKLFMEAAANTATLLSIIAIAAAPFTGGASMALMVPSMIIGAVPSAYNIITRGIDHRLHFDLALAMDVVNVVGAAVGAGAETRAGMEAIRLGTTTGRVLIVTGLGVMGASVLLMSEGVLEQLESVENLPEGLRGAEVMKILGHFMKDAGILVGGMLAAHGRARGELAPMSFEDWLGELDSQTRDRVQESRTQVDPTRNFWKIYQEMDPGVRDLLTQCGSDCIPMDPPPTKPEQARIKKFSDALTPKAKRTLKGLLHDNRSPAAMDTLLTEIENARDKAPASRGGTKKAAAAEQAVLARGTPADYILAEFSEGPVEALDVKNPGKWKRARQLADEIGKAGHLDIEAVARVLDNVRRTEGGDPEVFLGYLKNLSDVAPNVDGVERILGGDGLGGGSRLKFKGATWTMKFLTESGRWRDVASFEEPVPGRVFDRIVDVHLKDGTRIEMKSWESWHNFADATFADQIMGDWLPTDNLRVPLIWAFEPGESIGTPADIIDRMNAALDKALQQKQHGYDDQFAARRVQVIKDKLPQIVRVGRM